MITVYEGNKYCTVSIESFAILTLIDLVLHLKTFTGKLRIEQLFFRFIFNIEIVLGWKLK